MILAGVDVPGPREWEPSSRQIQGPRWLSLFTYEGVASLFRILSYIIWPILISAWTGLLKKRRARHIEATRSSITPGAGGNGSWRPPPLPSLPNIPSSSHRPGTMPLWLPGVPGFRSAARRGA